MGVVYRGTLGVRSFGPPPFFLKNRDFIWFWKHENYCQVVSETQVTNNVTLVTAFFLVLPRYSGLLIAVGSVGTSWQLNLSNAVSCSD